MGIIKSAFLIAAAAVGGIYLTSEEGKKARISIRKKKSIFDPIIKSLLKEAQSVLEGSKEIDSDKVRANINYLVNESKKILLNIDFEDAVDTVRKAIKVASGKIREASKTSDTKLNLPTKKTISRMKKTSSNKKTTKKASK